MDYNLLTQRLNKDLLHTKNEMDKFKKIYNFYKDNIYTEIDSGMKIRSKLKTVLNNAKINKNFKKVWFGFHLDYYHILNYILRSPYFEILDKKINESRIKFDDICSLIKNGVPIVYFAKEKKSSFVKIGFSNDHSKRIKSLDSASPRGVEYIYLRVGGIENEKDMHKRFLSSHVKHEWFKLSKDIEKFIRGELKNTKYIESRDGKIFYDDKKMDYRPYLKCLFRE